MSIKTGEGKATDDQAGFVCWNKDAQAQALRVETNCRVFIFPFTHIVFVVLKTSPKGDELRVSLTTHDVHVHGRNLREIALAFQKFAVEWIAAVPPRFAPLAARESAFIESIAVIEIESDSAKETLKSQNERAEA